MRHILFTFLMFFNFLRGSSQDALLQDYKNENFELRYPKKWKLDTSAGRHSFYYNAKLGDITISVLESQALSDKELQEMILEVNEQKEQAPNVKLTRSNGLTICTYNYVSEKVKYFIKAIKKENTVYLISLNWNEDSWDSFEDLLLTSYNSFKLR